jgi:hypothetical protein
MELCVHIPGKFTKKALNPTEATNSEKLLSFPCFSDHQISFPPFPQKSQFRFSRKFGQWAERVDGGTVAQLFPPLTHAAASHIQVENATIP